MWRFRVNLQATRTVQRNLDLGTAALSLALSFDASVTFTLTLTLNLELVIGIDRNALNTTGEGFYLQIESFTVTANAAAQDLDLGARLGILGLQVTGGNIALDASVTVAPVTTAEGAYADHRFSLAELANTPLASLVTATGSGNLHGTLPVTLGLLDDGGRPFETFSVSTTLSFGLDAGANSLFTGGAPKITVGDSSLAWFATLGANDLLGLLNQVRDWLNLFRNSAAFAQSIPFVQGLNLGKALDLAGAMDAAVNSLLTTTEGLPKFLSIQKLLDLVPVLGKADFVQRNPNNAASPYELTFHLDLNKVFNLGAVDLNFAGGLGESIASLTTNSKGAVTASVHAGFTLGVLLAPLDRGFQISLKDGSTFFLEVRGITSLDALETKVRDASSGKVRVVADEEHRGMIRLTDTSSGISTFRIEVVRGYKSSGGEEIRDPLVSDDDGDGMLTNLKLAEDTLTNHLFLKLDQADNFEVALELALTDLNAKARLLFVEAGVVHGRGSLRAALSLGLHDPGTGTAADNRITLTELLDALLDPARLGALVGGLDDLNFSGSASLVLPLEASLLGATLPGKPQITILWPDITNLSTLQPEFNQDAQDYLRLAQDLFEQGISGGLMGIVRFLSTLENFGVLREKLPGINRSVVELLQMDDALDAVRLALEAGPPAVVQGLESALKGALKLPQDSPDVGVTLDGGPEARALKIHLRLATNYSRKMPLDVSLASLGLSGVSNLFDVGGKALVTVEASGTLTIDLGIDLTNPGNPQPFLYDSTALDIGAKVAGSGLEFTAALGPLGLFVLDGSIALNLDGAGTTPDPASFSVKFHDGNGDGRHYFSESLLNDLRTDLTGAAEVRLPLYFPTRSNPLIGIDSNLDKVPDLPSDLDSDGILDHHLVLRVASLSDPIGTLSLIGPKAEDFRAVFGNIDLMANLNAMTQSWTGIMDLLDQVLGGRVFGINLPLIGDQLKGAQRFVRELRQKVLDNFLYLGDSPHTDEIQRAIFDAVGPGGINWLKDANRDGIYTPQDVLLSGESNAEQVQFDLQLGQVADLVKLDSPIHFDVGLPGLGLELTGSVQVRLGFDLDLSIGINRDDGVYLVTDQSDSEFRVYLDARIPGMTLTGRLGFFTVSAQDDALDPSHITGSFVVDLKDPSGDGRLTLADLQSVLSNPGAVVDGRFSTRDRAVSGSQPAAYRWDADQGSASFSVAIDSGAFSTVTVPVTAVEGNQSLADLLTDLNNAINAVAPLKGKLQAQADKDGLLVLQLLQGGYFELANISANNPAAKKLFLQNGRSTDLSGPAGPAFINLDLRATVGQGLPALMADFSIAWGFDSADTGSGLAGFGSAPIVHFGNVGMVLGDFFGKLVGPIFAQIQSVTDPLRPIINTLSAPIPVISDLAGHPITLLDVAKYFGLADVED